jgi:hypothetical protein
MTTRTRSSFCAEFLTMNLHESFELFRLVRDSSVVLQSLWTIEIFSSVPTLALLECSEGKGVVFKLCTEMMLSGRLKYVLLIELYEDR